MGKELAAAERAAPLSRGRLRLRRAACLVVFALAATVGLAERVRPAPAQADPPGTIYTAGAVHALPAEQARLGLPVHLHAVVTYYDPQAWDQATQATLYVADPTGGIYVSLPARPILPLQEGTRVDIAGITDPGTFASIVTHVKIEVLGQSPIPKHLPLVTVPQLATGAFDCGWVELEGTVHSVAHVSHLVEVKVATRDGPIVGYVVEKPGVDYDRLVDAKVRVRGVAGADYNTKQQMTGSHLFVSSIDAIQVLQPPRGDPFTLPVRPISKLAQFDPHATVGDRVHIRGRVTMQWPGHLLCVQDSTGGLCVNTAKTDLYPMSSLVDIVGYPVFAAVVPALTDAVMRAGPVQPGAVAPQTIDSAAALTGEHSGEVVSMEGLLVGVSSHGKEWLLTISSQQTIFTAELPKRGSTAVHPEWQEGSYVRVSGVCVDEVDGRTDPVWSTQQHFSSFRILLRTADDVVVLRTPSWWTPAHIDVVLGSVTILTLAIACWVILLRRRVEQKTLELRESEGRFRHLAHHDSLTGVPNRAWFYEKAPKALEDARESGRYLALLLLDLDHFKRINDTLGHNAGDLVLCALAERVQRTLRKTDTVARLGGDEFVVLLCNLNEEAEAEMVATKILSAVCRPLLVGNIEVPMSTSIGVCIFPSDGTTLSELLQNADAAMYRSKSSMRGGIQRYALPASRRASEDLERELIASSGSR